MNYLKLLLIACFCTVCQAQPFPVISSNSTQIGPDNLNILSFTKVSETKTLFIESCGQQGTALWVSDGTENGTTRIWECQSIFPHFVGNIDNVSIFTVGRQVFKSDGTSAGTSLIDTIPSQYGNIYPEFVLDNRVYFFTASRIFVTDGSTLKMFYTTNNAPSSVMPDQQGGLFYIEDYFDTNHSSFKSKVYHFKISNFENATAVIKEIPNVYCNTTYYFSGISLVGYKGKMIMSCYNSHNTAKTGFWSIDSSGTGSATKITDQTQIDNWTNFNTSISIGTAARKFEKLKNDKYANFNVCNKSFLFDADTESVSLFQGCIELENYPYSQFKIGDTDFYISKDRKAYFYDSTLNPVNFAQTYATQSDLVTPFLTGEAINIGNKILAGNCSVNGSEAQTCKLNVYNLSEDQCPNDNAKVIAGVCGCGIADTDTDNDGTKDCHETCDSDPLKTAPGVCGCGISDSDSDSDSISDCLETCDNDPFKIAPGVCGCGIADTDSDNDVTADCNETCDNDPLKIAPGVCGCGIADTDTDSDGTKDCVETCDSDPLKTAPGVCGCGVADTDTDNDGTKDCVETCDSDPLKTAPGVCGCGVADTDTDNDGTKDCVETCDSDPLKTAPGVCGCGVADTDTDNDGTKDCVETCDSDPLKTAPGVCGCGVADTDTDNDGTKDCNDLCPSNPDKTAAGTCGCSQAETDSDHDGTKDCVDLCPNDSLKTAAGICGCGVVDTDTDKDGTKDCVELCDNDPLKTVTGACGCGIADTDTDRDGTADCIEMCDNDPLKTAEGVCGCGFPDKDQDGDGSLDCNDLCPTDTNKFAAGVCGCGFPDKDQDGDGSLDCNDLCPTDKNKLVAGVCGCGVIDQDLNSNGTMDCKDLGMNLTSPLIVAKKAQTTVQLPKTAGLRFSYTYTFYNKTKKVLVKSGAAVNGQILKIKTPKKVTQFRIKYLVKGSGYKDFQSPEYVKAVK